MEARLELQNDNQSTSYFPFLFSPKSISIYISTFHLWPMFLSGLQLHLSRAPRRVLRTFCHQLADPRGPEALPPKCLPHLHVLQPKDFPLGRARHGSVRGGEGERRLCLCFSRLRFRIWAVMELQR